MNVIFPQDMVDKEFPIFPIVPNGKDPLIKRGFYGASADPDVIAAWREQYPDCNWAVWPGKDFVVIDIDVKGGIDGVANFKAFMGLEPWEDLPDTFTVQTPSGGFHLYYAGGPYGNSDKQLPEGVNIRAALGYALTPGSVIDGKAYKVVNAKPIRPLPSMIAERLSKPLEKSAIKEPHCGWDTPENTHRAVAMLKAREGAIQGQGGNSHTYVTATMLKDLAISEDKALELLLEHWNEKCDPLWPEWELRAVVENAYHYGKLAVGSKASIAEWPDDGLEAITDTKKADDKRLPRPTVYRGRNPKKIPRREWLYGDNYIRKFVTVTNAPGGLGKSTLVKAEVLAMTTGKPILGECDRMPEGKLRVWYINLEDPKDEIDRGLEAIKIHHEISDKDHGDRLFADSGRDMDFVIARKVSDRFEIVEPVYDAILGFIKEYKIDVIIVDPFIKSHGVPENDTTNMAHVTGLWAAIAEKGNCAVHLVHHNRKAAPREDGSYASADIRGAGSFLDLARGQRGIYRMTKADAKAFGLRSHAGYIWTGSDDEKTNLVPPRASKRWFHLASVGLGNGDSDHKEDFIGVVEPWTPPNPMDAVTHEQYIAILEKVNGGKWGAAKRANDWVGKAIAEVLGLDLSDQSAKQTVDTIFETYLADKTFKVVTDKGKNRHNKDFVVLANRGRADLEFNTCDIEFRGEPN